LAEHSIFALEYLGTMRAGAAHLEMETVASQDLLESERFETCDNARAEETPPNRILPSGCAAAARIMLFTFGSKPPSAVLALPTERKSRRESEGESLVSHETFRLTRARHVYGKASR
jgi:hypothetical protein